MIRWAAIPTVPTATRLPRSSIQSCLPDYDAWASLYGKGRTRTRAAVARGQALFNTLAIPIRATSPASTTTSASRSSSARAPVPRHAARRQSLGADAARHRDRRSARLDRQGRRRRNKFGLPVGDMPIYALKKIGSDDLQVRHRSRPGARLGKWKDIGRFKGTDPARACRARAVLPQRLGGIADRRGQLLRHAIQPRADRTRRRPISSLS